MHTIIGGGLLGGDSLKDFESKMITYFGTVQAKPSTSEIFSKIRAFNPSPIDFGRYVGYKTLRYMRQDGSNFDGATGSYGEQCSANCNKTFFIFKIFF